MRNPDHSNFFLADRRAVRTDRDVVAMASEDCCWQQVGDPIMEEKWVGRRLIVDMEMVPELREFSKLKGEKSTFLF